MRIHSPSPHKLPVSKCSDYFFNYITLGVVRVLAQCKRRRTSMCVCVCVCVCVCSCRTCYLMPPLTKWRSLCCIPIYLDITILTCMWALPWWTVAHTHKKQQQQQQQLFFSISSYYRCNYVIEFPQSPDQGGASEVTVTPFTKVSMYRQHVLHVLYQSFVLWPNTDQCEVYSYRHVHQSITFLEMGVVSTHSVAYPQQKFQFKPCLSLTFWTIHLK